ncbi:kelch repeat protein [Verrucomicrobiia bacterium DG1235]|nr:kelch repeat protein [Verrucomicrobiae bacterium DG1235]
MLRFLLLGLASLCGLAVGFGQVPTMINYQGRLIVDGVNFSGDGQFKFAFVNEDGSATYWSHDDSSVSGSEPSTHVVLPVSSGLYSVMLGDPNVKNSAGEGVQSISATVLGHSEVYLRIWVKAGTSGFQKLAPDRRIAAVAYALMADSVPDGSITTEKLAAGSVTEDKLAFSVSDSVVDGSITTAKLENSSVSSAKLATGSVTAEKLSVTTSELVSTASISTAMLAAGSVTSEKLAASSVTSAKLASASVTAEKLSVTASQLIPAGSITTEMLAPGAVTAEKLAVSTGGGNFLASLLAADSDLLNGGFVRVLEVPAKVWQSPVSSDVPSSRTLHSSVWTGSDMIVWGGNVGSALSNQGGVYNPETFEWNLLPISDVSPARNRQTTVWTGDRMIVWGGYIESGITQTGAIYAPEVPDANPPIGGWLSTSLESAPVARSEHTAVWTGSKMLIWGGKNSGGVLSSGSSYTAPSGPLVPGEEGSWSEISNTNAPEARHGHTAVWTGSKMLVWGGLDSAFSTLGTGAIYDPASNTWTSLPTAGAPSARTGHSAVWTGSKMIVFGGTNSEIPGSASNLLNDGAAFDPITGTWSAIDTVDAPSGRFNHGALWTGSEMLIVAGEALSGQVVNSGAAYNFAADTWRSLPDDSSASAGQSQLWTGGEILVFGANGLRTLDSAPAVYFYARF